MKTMLIATLLAAAVAAPALAQEPARAFDGPYVGLQLGLNRDQAGARLAGGTTLDAKLSRNSLATGIYAGWNIPLGKSLVLAPEAGIGLNVNDSVEGRWAGLATTLDPKRTIDLGARLGVRVGENSLVYARGGYSNVRVDRTDTLAGGGKLRTDTDYQGWSLGGGVEHRLTDSLSARIEYRFANLDQDGGDWRRHQVLAGVNFNF